MANWLGYPLAQQNESAKFYQIVRLSYMFFKLHIVCQHSHLVSYSGLGLGQRSRLLLKRRSLNSFRKFRKVQNLDTSLHYYNVKV